MLVGILPNSNYKQESWTLTSNDPDPINNNWTSQ